MEGQRATVRLGAVRGPSAPRSSVALAASRSRIAAARLAGARMLFGPILDCGRVARGYAARIGWVGTEARSAAARSRIMRR